MTEKRQKTTATQIKISIFICVGIVAYSFWRLHRAVSELQVKLIGAESLAEHAEDICRFHYFVAAGFLVLGILLGLGIGAYRLTQDRREQ